MKLNRISIFILILAITCTFFVGCKNIEETNELKIISNEDLKNIPENTLDIEWLGSQGYNVDNPTMIYIHGEMSNNANKRVDLSLDQNYIMYGQDSVNYNVSNNVTIERNLYTYWEKQHYNVGIFHYEKFADCDLNKLSKKLYNAIDMSYKEGENLVENSIPNYSLTEILASRYIEAIPKEAYGKEIRLVGNGIGANLALSLSDCLYHFYKNGQIPNTILPTRLALMDPYLSTDKFENNIKWSTIEKNSNMLNISNEMLTYTTNMGLVAEMVENVEVSAVSVENTSVEKLTPAYEFSYNDEQKTIKEEIKDKTAYLTLREKYSTNFSKDFKKQNRVALDWYLYSINGSDDTGIGYSTSKPDYSSSYCNWGPYETRPFINNRQLNNNSTRGKKFAISAWTPTVYTRALKGIEFKMQKYSDYLEDENGEKIKDIHGNSLYVYEDYTLARFRSENYQNAQNIDKTIVCGYVFNDKNEDRIMNEGIGCLLDNLTINVALTKSVDGETIDVNNFSVTTSKDGFYYIEFENSFEISHTVTLTVVPKNNTYNVESTGLNTYFYEDLSRHIFNNNTKSLTMSSGYGNSITVANCGMVIKK